MWLLFVEELKHHIECPSPQPFTDLNIPSWQGVHDFSAPPSFMMRQFKSEVQQVLMDENKILRKVFDSQEIFSVCD